VRFPNPRGADARRSCLGSRLSPVCERLRLPIRYARRADGRYSCSSVARSPNSARFSPDSVRFTEPRRADARRSWCPREDSPNCATSPLQVRFLNPRGGLRPPLLSSQSVVAGVWAIAVPDAVLSHDGLTVATLVRPLQGRRIVRGFRRAAFGSPIRGGLTVAALVAYATRRRKSRISQATHVEQPRAAGVSQPWFPKRNCIAFTVHYGEPSAYQPTAACARQQPSGNLRH
jgi:hypothetical protein